MSWHTIVAFESAAPQRDPAALLRAWNLGSPVRITEGEFSWQLRQDGTVLGWALLRGRGWVARWRVLRWLRRDALLRFVAEGELDGQCLDLVVWGL
jgi:hypothetical protein